MRVYDPVAHSTRSYSCSTNMTISDARTDRPEDCIPSQRIQEACERLGVPYFETTAKDNKSINQPFVQLVRGFSQYSNNSIYKV